MNIRHLRNATTILSLGEHHLLVDPMLAKPGALPGFKLFGGGRRKNPLVPLPPETESALATVTGVIITHEHPDHLDSAGLRWIKEHRLPVWASGEDAPNLARKGLSVHELRDGALGMRVEVVSSRHGQGLLGWLLGPVAGFYLAHPGEPSLYVIGDSVLTESVVEAVARLQPEVIIAPAGAANGGLGGDILFSVDELVELVKLARGKVVLNHLEALDHCPTTRRGLRERMAHEGLSDRIYIPEDGEQLDFQRGNEASPHARPKAGAGARPGLQKWVTARFAVG